MDRDILNQIFGIITAAHIRNGSTAARDLDGNWWVCLHECSFGAWDGITLND
jgi:hypothetical protein